VNIFLGAFSYFLALFLLGFLFGPIRIFQLQPRFGKLVSVLIEAPFMISAMPWVALWNIQFFKIPADSISRLLMGGLAWVFLILAEIIASRLMMKMSFDRYLKRLKTPHGLVGMGIMIIFAAVPLCLLWF
jgi:hypothetical protein